MCRGGLSEHLSYGYMIWQEADFPAALLDEVSAEHVEVSAEALVDVDTVAQLLASFK